MKNIVKVLLVFGAFLCSVFAVAQTVDAPEASDSAQADEIQVVAVYPNPASERLLVEFTSEDWGEDLPLRIVNSEGKTILKRKLLAAPGGNMVILQVGELPLGEYVVQLDQGRRAKAVKWQKL